MFIEIQGKRINSDHIVNYEVSASQSESTLIISKINGTEYLKYSTYTEADKALMYLDRIIGVKSLPIITK